jgi:hypothetical protein
MKLDLLRTVGIEYLGDSELLHPYGTEGPGLGHRLVTGDRLARGAR